MTDQWKDRIIRGGAIAVMTVAALGCMVWLTSIIAGYPGALRAGGIIPAVQAAPPHDSSPKVRAHASGQTWTIDGTVFEMWLGRL